MRLPFPLLGPFRLLGPLRSLELFLLVSLLVLPIAPLRGLLRRSTLVFLGLSARLVCTHLIRARLVCACLRFARFVAATSIDALLLRLCSVPATARAPLSLLIRRLWALVLPAVSIALTVLRLGRCRNEQQRCGRRKYAYVFHTVPQSP